MSAPHKLQLLGRLILCDCGLLFLQQFRPLDAVLDQPRYLPDFTLTRPGYNDGGNGQRFLYVGPEAAISVDVEAISKFLDVMAFNSEADRTNADPRHRRY